MVRSLNVGDFLWVAVERRKPERVLVLPHLVERKRMDDLISSIRSQRYDEQKQVSSLASTCFILNAIKAFPSV